MSGMPHRIIGIDSNVTDIKNNEGQKGRFMKVKQLSQILDMQAAAKGLLL